MRGNGENKIVEVRFWGRPEERAVFEVVCTLLSEYLEYLEHLVTSASMLVERCSENFVKFA